MSQDNTSEKLPPRWLRPIFVVSQSDQSFLKYTDQLSDLWKTYIVQWKAVESIDYLVWLFKEKIAKTCQLTDEELRLADAHVALWRDCVRRKKAMFIVSDTSRFSPDMPDVLITLEQTLKRMKNANIQFDFLHILHESKDTPKQYVTNYVEQPNIVIPSGISKLDAYVISPRGAAFLLGGVTPFEQPIGVYVQHRLEQDKTGQFRCYAVYPSL